MKRNLDVMFILENKLSRGLRGWELDTQFYWKIQRKLGDKRDETSLEKSQVSSIKNPREDTKCRPFREREKTKATMFSLFEFFFPSFFWKTFEELKGAFPARIFALRHENLMTRNPNADRARDPARDRPCDRTQSTTHDVRVSFLMLNLYNQLTKFS